MIDPYNLRLSENLSLKAHQNPSKNKLVMPTLPVFTQLVIARSWTIRSEKENDI